MNRPVLPLVYAAISCPFWSNTRWTGRLDPIPAAHSIDLASSRSDSSKGPPRVHVVEPEAKIAVILAGLGAADAAIGGASIREAGATSRQSRTRATAATAAESRATCERREGSAVAPSRSRITTLRPLPRAVDPRHEAIRTRARQDETSRSSFFSH